MRRFGAVVALAALGLAGSCAELFDGQADDDADAEQTPSPGLDLDPPEQDATKEVVIIAVEREQGLDLCGLVSDDTLDPLRTEFEMENEPAIGMLRSARTFLACEVDRFLDEPGISWAIRDPAMLSNPGVEDLVNSWSQEGSMTEVDLDGVSAQLVTITGEDGLQYLVTFEQGGLEVIVDANTFDPETYDVDLALDLTLNVAEEVAANMDGRVPTAVDLIDQCPAADDPQLVEAMDGEAVLAVGTDRGSGELYQQSVGCRYANEHMYTELNWQERAEGLDPIPEPQPFSDQQIFEVRDHPVRLLGEQSGGELVADGQCGMDVQYRPVDRDSWWDFPTYPSERSASSTDGDKLRDEKTVMFLEAIYDLNGC